MKKILISAIAIFSLIPFTTSSATEHIAKPGGGNSYEITQVFVPQSEFSKNIVEKEFSNVNFEVSPSKYGIIIDIDGPDSEVKKITGITVKKNGLYIVTSKASLKLNLAKDLDSRSLVKQADMRDALILKNQKEYFIYKNDNTKYFVPYVLKYAKTLKK